MRILGVGGGGESAGGKREGKRAARAEGVRSRFVLVVE